MSYTLDLSDLIAQLRADILAEIQAGLAEREWAPWMRLDTAATYLDMSPERLRKLVARRAIPFSQEGPGCRVFFERSALDEWMRSQQM
jgi:excisionase family DNA binding protein